jgi:branched-chain amino acid transport system ATP-binding protein
VTPPPALLSVKDLEARYDRFPVLDRVSLEVRPGEIVCLLGSNGAGKTTLIRAILGIVRPAGGQVWVFGRRVDGWRPHAIQGLGLGVVPEGRRLFPKMSVAENLLMGALRVHDAARVRERVEELARLFPLLLERSRQPAGTLSGGEQAQVAIARGLMGRPRLLVLDEPSLGLSPRLSLEVFRLIRTIRAADTATLLVEQNARQSLAIADRGYLLQKGRIVASGSAADLRADPQIRRAYLLDP